MTPRRRRREPPPPLLPRPRDGGARDRPVGDGRSRSSGRCATSRCPAPASPTSRARARRSPTAGVYDFAIHHDQILVPVVMKHWRIEQLQNLKSAAEQARERLVKHVEKVGNVAKRMKTRLAPRPARPESTRAPQLERLNSSASTRALARGSAWPSNCTRPRSTIRSCAHAIAGRPTIASVRSSGARSSNSQANAGLGAAVHRAQLQAGGALQVAVDRRRRGARRAPRRRPGRRSAAGTAAGPGSPRSRCGRSPTRPRHHHLPHRRLPVDGERAEPRPPLAVALGVRERRPELRLGSRRSARPGRSETVTAPQQLRRPVRQVQAATRRPTRSHVRLARARTSRAAASTWRSRPRWHRQRAHRRGTRGCR